jgi:type I restriction enzyme, S subunit
MQDETLTETLSLIDEKTEGLPEGWRLVRLGDICQIKGGKRLPAGTDFSVTKTNFPYIRVLSTRQ